MEIDSTVIFAFFLTLLAGLSTGVGGLIAFTPYAKKDNFLAFGLGLAAGAMLFISFFEMLFGALDFLAEDRGFSSAFAEVVLYFMSGLIIIALLTGLIEYILKRKGLQLTDLSTISSDKQEGDKSKKLYRSGIVTAVALAVHNLPEGLVTFLATIQDVQLGIGIAIAIAIHNIPEGMAVSLPIYRATGNKKKAILITVIAGLSEPIGALLAYFLFFQDFSEAAMEIVNIFLATIMIYVSLFEILPTASQLDCPNHTKWGLLAGMAVMGATLVFLM
jgi:zinc transporter, ZIP family